MRERGREKGRGGGCCCSGAVYSGGFIFFLDVSSQSEHQHAF